MAGSLNRAQLIGNLGRDPEIRSTQAGKKIANLALATSDSWTDKRTGERQQRTEWHRIVIFDEQLADVAERYCRKGSKVFVEGQIQTRKWTDNAGVERYATEIVLSGWGSTLTLLDRPPGDGGGRAPATGGTAPAAGTAPRPRDPLDDDIPF